MKTKNQFTKNQFKMTAVAGLLSVFGGANAATDSDPFVSVATVIDSCDVIATGINFGPVVSPMIAPVIGALPNTADTHSLTDVIPGVSLAAPGVAGVMVVCTSTPSSIVVTLQNGATANLTTTPAASLAGKLYLGGSTSAASINYTLKFAGLTAPTAVAGILPIYAAAFLADPTATQIPVQSLGGAGSYSDTGTVVINY